MCGLTGIFNYVHGTPVEETVLRSMCQTIAHRGPDGEGIFLDPKVGLGLGHRRLSIIDLTTGDQPMSNDAKTIWIVFNGEIYNFPELKAELQQRGLTFRTTSDTEVIIYMYQAYGENALVRLNGIFSLAIYDSTKRMLLVARDHFGVKPMYYSDENGRLIFGSEIKAILAGGGLKREIDVSALNTFLTMRYNPSPETMFRNIHKLPPAHYLKVIAGEAPVVSSYWSYTPKTDLRIREAEAVEEYQRLLEAAVKRQMTSDVPVGLMLSGGIDSAVVGMLMRDHAPSRIKTFSIGFSGKGDFNELDDARASAALIGSEHFEMTITQEEYLDFFMRSFHYTEEPIAEPTIPALYYVSQLAARHVKVVLAGQGADEPLAGYKRYFGEKYIARYAGLLRLAPMQILSSALKRNERFKRAAYASRFKDEMQRFLGIYTIFTPAQKKELFRPEWSSLSENHETTALSRLYGHTTGLHDSLSKLLFIDTRMYLSDDLLIFGDKMAMANSLEMRVPYLDVPLIRFLETLPSTYKLNGRIHKYIHKQALKKYLPREIIQRKKRGFSTPIDEWLQYSLGGRIRDLVDAQDSLSRQFFNLSYIHTMIEDHRMRRENHQRHLFALLSLELWYRNFFHSR